MQAHSETSGSGRAPRAKVPRLVVDPEKLKLDDSTIIVSHTRDGGYICLGFGAAGDFLDAVENDQALDKAIASPTAGAGDPFLRRLATAVALVKDYDPNQPRDDDGRWTNSGGGSGAASDGTGAGSGSSSAVAAAGTALAADARSIYGNSNLTDALKEMGARAFAAVRAAAMAVPGGVAVGAVAVGGAAAVLGTLFFPTSRHLATADGTLPDAPEFSYHFDQEAGHLTVTDQRADGTRETVFDGRYDKDGIFRDSDGNPVGRFLGDSVALDADAIRGYEARRESDSAAQAGAVARSTVVARSEPRLCPEPSPDKPGWKSPAALAYQMFVGMYINRAALPPGFGIKMMRPNGLPTYFDDCDYTVVKGTLVDAKGEGYLDQLRKGSEKYPWIGTFGDMLDQTKRQLEAAQGRPIKWYFAEPEVGAYVRAEFERRKIPIQIIDLPAPPGLLGGFERIFQGVWNELRYLRSMLS